MNKGFDQTRNKTSRSLGDIPDTQTKGLLLKMKGNNEFDQVWV